MDLDQPGFNPQRSTYMKLRRLFTNLQFPHPDVEGILISLDAYKAFDSVETGKNKGEYTDLWPLLDLEGHQTPFSICPGYRATSSSTKSFRSNLKT